MPSPRRTARTDISLASAGTIAGQLIRATKRAEVAMKQDPRGRVDILASQLIARMAERSGNPVIRETHASIRPLLNVALNHMLGPHRISIPGLTGSPKPKTRKRAPKPYGRRRGTGARRVQ